ncbi:MAG: PAS domain S-box protein [Thainema sp.]
MRHLLDWLPPWQTGRTVPLQRALIVPFVLQIVAAVGLVGYISFRNGQQAVYNLSSQLRTEIVERIKQQLQSYIEIPHSINRINGNSVFKGDIDISRATGEHQFWQQAKIFSYTNLIYCATDIDGSFLGVGRNEADQSLQLVIYNDSTNHIANYYGMNITGDRTYLLSTGDRPFDPRVRPWYTAAKAAGGPTWSDIYLDFDTQLPTITASLPIYEEFGNGFIGVCATDFILPEEMSRFLRTLKVGESGKTFIVERSGTLVSTSTAEDLLIAGHDDAARRREAVESENPLVQGAAEYLNQRFGNLNNIQRSHQLEFTVDGKRQFLQVLPFRDGRGLDWLIVVVVPEADFMAQIHQNTRITIVLCAIALLVAIWLGLHTSRWLARPILKLDQASRQIANGNLDQTVTVKGVDELEALANSFNSMAQQLQRSFTNLQDSEATNRALVQAMPDLLLRVRQDGLYLDIQGEGRTQIHNANHFKVGSSVHECLPTELANEWMHYVQQALTTGKIQVYEQRLQAAQGRRIEEVRMVALCESEVLIIVRNITERKEVEQALQIAEEKYRSIYENALEGIFQSSPAHRYISVNPAMARIHGYSSPLDMVEQITDISKQIYVDAIAYQQFRQQIETAGQVEGFEYQAYCADGVIIWLSENARAVYDDSGTLLYYEGIVQDITERKRKERDLKRQLEELQIEIDHQKRERDVAQITQTDYFREIQAAANSFNLDDFWDE